MYKRVKRAGAGGARRHDFGFETGFYFYDPDGNRSEI